MSYVVGDLVCGILSYVVCVLLSCAWYYLEVKYRDWITCDVLRIWNVVCVIV